jgi:hypothetical protein
MRLPLRTPRLRGGERQRPHRHLPPPHHRVAFEACPVCLALPLHRRRRWQPPEQRSRRRGLRRHPGTHPVQPPCPRRWASPLHSSSRRPIQRLGSGRGPRPGAVPVHGSATFLGHNSRTTACLRSTQAPSSPTLRCRPSRAPRQRSQHPATPRLTMPVPLQTRTGSGPRRSNSEACR